MKTRQKAIQAHRRWVASQGGYKPRNPLAEVGLMIKLDGTLDLDRLIPHHQEIVRILKAIQAEEK